MIKPSFYFPAKPYVITQDWGIPNPIYKQFGFTQHNGVDIRMGTDKTLYAPGDGTVVRTGNQPQGGGIFFGIMSDVYTWPDGKDARVLFDFLHCEKLLVEEGQKVKTGDKLAIADNTGFSTGPHTHIQCRRAINWNGKSGVDLVWKTVDKNGANNSFNPAPYWNGMWADEVHITRIQLQIISLLKKMLGIS